MVRERTIRGVALFGLACFAGALGGILYRHGGDPSCIGERCDVPAAHSHPYATFAVCLLIAGCAAFGLAIWLRARRPLPR